ncbi:DUF4974 domain-containing protein [Flavobacterium zepuense]|uniref:DUF4974 domain-containing protein n=1 Tax=Flavobacterium zepuense TaxID=2593302 RepID=A0A552V2M4_9FLAO|nr:FecR domain-containing protein [Flavobacterium zepuense]TRW24698.1 DUF4974 domain-containing protein [Flavobacterium zepuense]
MKDDVTLARWLNNEMDENELKEFEQSPGYATYSKIKEFSAQLTVPQADMDSLYQKIEARKNRDTVKVRQLNPWMPRIAAMLVLALGAAYFFISTHVTTHFAHNAQRETFLLPDNSEVVLNSGTEAEYKEWNWAANRRIELKGEAYFKVAKGETFDVVTPNGTITVVGTQFNVKARNGRLDVTCYEGKVKVTTANKEEIILTPGMTVGFANGKNLQLPNEEGDAPGWLEYETSFSKVNLPDVIEELERQYNKTITFKGITPKSPYSGTLPMNDIETALETVETIYHLKATQTGDTIILTAE